MKIRLSILSLATLLVLVFSQAPLAFAQEATPAPTDTPTTTTNSNCPPSDLVNDNPQPISADNVHDNVNNYLAGIFSRGSLNYRLRCDPLIVNTDGNVSIYSVAKNLVNFAVLIILIVIAFANILRIKLDTYAVKKAVPLLVFGVIMANLGLPIIRTIVDFSGVLSATVISSISTDGTKTGFVQSIVSSVYEGGAVAIGNTLTGLAGGSSGWATALGLAGIGFFSVAAMGPAFVFVVVGLIFLLVFPAIMFLILGLLFIARLYVLVILTAVSPLAFASLGFEPLKSRIWGWWWGQFIKWTFMAPATFALFWVGAKFHEAVGTHMDIGTYVVTLSLVYAATQIPLKMGGSIMANWNNALVKPLNQALNKPFMAARDYVKTAGPRDASRFLSSKTVGNLIPGAALRGRLGIISRIPLNPVKATREGVSTAAKMIEERNAKGEATSAAALTGVAAGKFFGSLSTEGVRGSLRASRGEDLFDTVEGRAQIQQLARQKLKQAQLDEGRLWRDMDKPEEDRFNAQTEEAIRSGNSEELAAMLAAHGLLGKQDVDDRLLAALDKLGQERNMNIDRLYRLHDDLFKRTTQISTATGGDFDSRYQKTLERIQADLAGRNKDKQEEYLAEMVTQLKSAVGSLDNIQEIEKHPNYKAWAKVLLTEGAKHDNIRNSASQLNRYRGQLGAVNIEAVMNNLPGLVQTLQRTAQQAGERVQAADLQPLLTGFDETDFTTRLDHKQQIATIVAYERHLDDVKRAMETYLRKEFTNMERQLQLPNNRLTNMVGGLVGPKGSVPQKIELNELRAVGIADDKAKQIIQRTEWYNKMTTSLETLRSQQAQNGPRIAQIIHQNQPAGHAPTPSGFHIPDDDEPTVGITNGIPTINGAPIAPPQAGMNQTPGGLYIPTPRPPQQP